MTGLTCFFDSHYPCLQLQCGIVDQLKFMLQHLTATS